MKNLKRVAILLVVLMVALTVKVSAMTESELIDYICSSHAINGSSIQLSAANKVKVERYFADNPATEEQANEMKAKLDATISYVESTGATDLSKLSSSQKETVLAKANEAAAVVGVSLTYDSKDGAVEVYKDGVKIESVSTATGTLVQTGSANYEYIIIPSLAIVAMAGIVFFINKKKANA